MAYTRPKTFVDGDNTKPADAAALHAMQDSVYSQALADATTAFQAADVSEHDYATAVATLASTNAVNANKDGPNVERDFGAVGNGSTNDVAAFQSGINWLVANGGGVLHAPAQYLIGTPGIVVPQNCQQSITIAGVSPGTSGSLARPSRLVRNGAYPIIKTTGTGITGSTLNHSPNLIDLQIDGGNTVAPILDFARVANTFYTRCLFINSHGEALKGQMMWNNHFTDCHFAGNGDFASSTPAVRLTDAGAGTLTGTNTVHFTACEFEGNLHDDLRMEGPNNGSVSVFVNGCKFERSNACAVRMKDSSAGLTVVGSMMYAERVDHTTPDSAILINGGQRATITGNLLGGGNPSPANLVYLATGANVTVMGNTFLSNGGNHIRADAGFGEVQIGLNSHNLFGSAVKFSDARTSKTGTYIANGTIAQGN